MSNKSFRRRIILTSALGVVVFVLVILIVWKRGAMQEEVEFSEEAKAYMKLQSDKWLTVCVWQVDGEPVLCGLLSGKYRYWSEVDTREGLEMGLKAGVTPEEMKQILATYDVPKERILVVAWTNPLSSRLYCPLGEQLEEIRKLLLKDK